ncbi:MAG: hypothetical protein ACRDTX_22895 [Pseudonocardiaceae bacterium]
MITALPTSRNVLVAGKPSAHRRSDRERLALAAGVAKLDAVGLQISELIATRDG